MCNTLKGLIKIEEKCTLIQASTEFKEAKFITKKDRQVFEFTSEN